MRPELPVKIQLRLFASGYCTHPEWVTLRGGAWSAAKFPAGFAYVEHPRLGGILIDTGYTSRFLSETSRLPQLLYRKLTPVHFRKEEEAANQLRAAGIDPHGIGFVVLTHFHADHIAGCKDFPHARFIYLQKSYDAVKDRSGLSAVRAGFLPGLLPEDFASRSMPISQESAIRLPFPSPYSAGYDLLGDGSLLAVELSGHAAGQIGLFLSTDRHDYFLCADAAWSSRAYRERRPPHPAARLIMSDPTAYMRNLEKLHELHRMYPELRIVPSHCEAALTAWANDDRDRDSKKVMKEE